MGDLPVPSAGTCLLAVWPITELSECWLRAEAIAQKMRGLVRESHGFADNHEECDS